MKIVFRKMDFSEEEKFTFIWKLENYKYCLRKRISSVKSPIVCLKAFYNTKWSFKFYFKGDNNTKQGQHSIYLRREEDDGPKTVDLYFELSIQSKLACLIRKKFFSTNVGYGVRFDSCELQNLTFIIVSCKMRMSPVPPTCLCSSENLPKNALPPCSYPISLASGISPALTSTCAWEMFKMQRKLCIFPQRCLAYSKLQVEKRFFCWPFNFQQEDVDIPVISLTDMTSLLLSIRIKEMKDNKILNIWLSLVDEKAKNFQIICKISVLDECENVIEVAKKCHLFDDGPFWDFGHNFILKSKSNTFDERMYLKCEFELSTGKLFEEILWTKDSYSRSSERNLEQDSVLPCRVLKKELVLQKQRKFGDVKLITMYKTFPAHKEILSAISPVFRARFASENSSNTFKICDVDSNTLERMLLFIYFGYVRDLNFDRAAALFSAADKYQINPLKFICRYPLLEHLNVKNIFFVLSLAYAHRDSTLEMAVFEYLALHKNLILLSSEWSKFFDENRKLACQVLLKMCLVYLKCG